MSLPTTKPVNAVHTTPAAISTKVVETKTNSTTSEKIADEDVQEEDSTTGRGFVFFFVFLILGVFGLAFIKFGGVEWTRMIVRKGGPKYRRLDVDLEK